MDDDVWIGQLQQSVCPPPSAGFAERIIAAAAMRPQQRPLGFLQWLGNLFAEAHLPKPAYSLAFALLLGIALGFHFSTTTVPSPGLNAQTEVAVSALLYMDEDVL